MEAIIQQFFNLEIMAKALPLVLKGLGMTLLICAVVIPLGAIGGLLAAIASVSRKRAVRWAAIGFVDLFRAIPPLVLLIFIYAGLPFAGIRVSPFAAVAVGFFLNILRKFFARASSRCPKDRQRPRVRPGSARGRHCSG